MFVLQLWNNGQPWCCLVGPGLLVQSIVVYFYFLGQIIGFTNLGEINDHPAYEKVVEQDEEKKVTGQVDAGLHG